MPSSNFVKDIYNGSIVLAIVKAENHINKLASILKKGIHDNKMRAICVSFNRPSKVMKRDFEKIGVDTSQIEFIDTVTRLSEDAYFEDNISYVDSPTELSTISVYIRNHLEKDPDVKKFIIIDSVSNLMNFVSEKEAITFIQTITNKLRLIEVGGSVMAITEDGGNGHELEKFGEFVDKKILL